MYSTQYILITIEYVGTKVKDRKAISICHIERIRKQNKLENGLAIWQIKEIML